jgi:sterol desaturase/sphingolipid hydroxylase (fatty acid hydroxylase superfamily)
LSFHPVESAVYFSPALVFLVMPSVFSPIARRLLNFGLLLVPCRGHHGFSRDGPHADDDDKPSHYIHHVKFDCNFGALIGFDHALGTDYSTRASKFAK